MSKISLASALLLLASFWTPAVSGTISDEKAEEAAQLLELSIKCPTEVMTKVSNNGTKRKIKNVYDSVGDLETLQITEGATILTSSELLWLDNTDSPMLGETEYKVQMISANFDQIDDVIVTDRIPGYDGEPYISLTCRNDKKCFTIGLLSTSYCHMFANDTDDCGQRNDGPIFRWEASNRQEVELYPCENKFKSVSVAVKLLAQHAVEKGRQSSAPLYRVAPKFFVPIRDAAFGPPYLDLSFNASINALSRDRSKDGAVLGILSSASGAVTLGHCEKVAGFKSRWCTITWGGVKGWISKAKLVPSGSQQ